MNENVIIIYVKKRIVNVQKYKSVFVLDTLHELKQVLL